MKVKDVIIAYEEYLEDAKDNLHNAKGSIASFKYQLRKLKKLDPESIYKD